MTIEELHKALGSFGLHYQHKVVAVLDGKVFEVDQATLADHSKEIELHLGKQVDTIV